MADTPVEVDSAVKDDPEQLAAYIVGVADDLRKGMERTGAFSLAQSALPALLVALGIVTFALGVVFRVTEPWWCGSREFNDFSLFAILLAATGAAVYIAEVRQPGRIKEQRAAIEKATDALDRVGETLAEGEADHRSVLGSATKPTSLGGTSYYRARVARRGQ